MNRKVIVGCEKSGRVREALRKRGWDAISVDLEPTDIPGNHIQDYLENVVGDGSGFDFGIFFPPCTYIAGSGLHWNKRTPGRDAKTRAALEFVAMILNLKIPRIVLENPVGCISTRIVCEEGIYRVTDEPVRKGGFKPLQTIQPYNFGEDASKRTCLWVKGDLPVLKNTGYFEHRLTPDGKKRWSNQTDSGQNKLGPSETRAADRAITYQGIADALAEQYSNYIFSKEQDAKVSDTTKLNY